MSTAIKSSRRYLLVLSATLIACFSSSQGWAYDWSDVLRGVCANGEDHYWLSWEDYDRALDTGDSLTESDGVHAIIRSGNDVYVLGQDYSGSGNDTYACFRTPLICPTAGETSSAKPDCEVMTLEVIANQPGPDDQNFVPRSGWATPTDENTDYCKAGDLSAHIFQTAVARYCSTSNTSGPGDSGSTDLSPPPPPPPPRRL